MEEKDSKITRDPIKRWQDWLSNKFPFCVMAKLSTWVLFFNQSNPPSPKLGTNDTDIRHCFYTHKHLILIPEAIKVRFPCQFSGRALLNAGREKIIGYDNNIKSQSWDRLTMKEKPATRPVHSSVLSQRLNKVVQTLVSQRHRHKHMSEPMTYLFLCLCPGSKWSRRSSDVPHHHSDERRPRKV